MNLKITVESIKEGDVILKIDDGKSISWPKDKLPRDINIGSSLVFVITNNEGDDNKNLAKNILNEILNPDSE